MKRWREDFGTWFSSLRFSGFTVLVVLLLVAGVVIVSPSLSTFVQQQRELSDLRESVKQGQKAVDDIDAERAKWKDPVYVRSQARDRLFYVLPGETQLNVIDDTVLPVESTETTEAKLSRMQSNWAHGLAGSFLTAATTKATPEELKSDKTAEQDPASEQTPTDTTNEDPEQ
ncbi:septum formation initiator family protein [Leucobacter coleopterorum]|uniref:Septum formation initiator family protein n=1 Tax=Leucobacter coleopterorum TaxID=2714933 RepID=A0ABX6JZM6_9MICO|nr:septum formation initiator family protein [Leucobacter coleopterorum]